MNETLYLSRDEWLAARMTGIGGSDAAAVIGQSPYKSAYSLWCEKTGAVEAEDIGHLTHIRWGSLLEDAVATYWREETGHEIRQTPLTIVRDEVHPFIFATPDFLFADGSSGLEIKTASMFKREDWADGPPLAVQIQAHQCMRVTGATEWHVCAFFGTTYEPFIGVVARNDRFLDALVTAEVEFWDMVETKRPPAPDGTEGTSRSIARLFPKVKGEGTVLGNEFTGDVTAWTQFSADLTKANAEVERLKKARNLHANRLRAAIGDASYGRIEGVEGGYFTNHETRKPGKYRRAQRYRTLRWKKEKKK